MADQDITLNIVARNGATPEIARVRNDLTSLEKTLGGVTREAKYLSDASDSSRGLGRHFTALSTTIASQLNPALGQTGGFMSVLAREGDRVSLGMTALGVSAAFAVGAFVQFNKILTEVAQRHVELARALASNDIGLSTGQLSKAITDLRVQTELLSAEPVRKFLGDISQLLSKFGITSGGFLESIFGTSVQQRAVREAQQAFASIFPAEVAQRVLKATQDIAAAKQTSAHVELTLAQETLNLNLAYAAQAASLAELKTKQDAATDALLRTQKNEQGALAFNFPKGIPEGTQKALEDAQAMERRALAVKQLTESEITTKALADAIRGIDLERLTIIRETVRAQGEFVLNAALGIKFGEEALGNLDELIAKGKSRGSVEKQTLELLQLQGQEIGKQQERLGLRGDIVAAGLQRGAIGGNQLTQNTVAIAVAESNRQTQLSQAALIQNPTDRALATEKANALTDTAVAKLRFDQSAKDNPLVGLQEGFRGVVDDFTATGTILRDGIRGLGSDMSRTFSDTFTSVVMGDFKKLADLPKAFAANVIKAFSDALGKAVVGNIFESFAGSLGLGGGRAVRGLGVLGGGLSAAPGAGGGGGGLVEVGDQLFQRVAAGGGQTVLVPAGMGGGGAAVGAAGQVGSAASGGTGFLSLFGSTGDAIKAFLNTPLSSVSASLFGSGSLAPSIAAGASTADLASLGATGSEIAAATSGAGATIGSALGGAAAAVGLAFTIYQGLTNPPTAANIATGAVSGALSGAILGATVGSVFPGVGTLVGAAVGAIAGGALGGGAASLGKPDPAAKKARQQAEVNRAQGAATSLGQAVQNTQSLEDLYALLAANNSGYFGGTSSVAIGSSIYVNGEQKVIGFVPALGFSLATIDEFSQFGPTTYHAGLQAGISQDFIDQSNASLSQTVRSQITRLSQSTGQIEVSTNDFLTSPFGGSLLRTTFFRANQAKAFAGQDLNVEGPSLAGLDDKQKVALLKNLAKLDRDLSLGILYRDPATDEIVSISTVGSTGMVVVQ